MHTSPGPWWLGTPTPREGWPRPPASPCRPVTVGKHACPALCRPGQDCPIPVPRPAALGSGAPPVGLELTQIGLCYSLNKQQLIHGGPQTMESAVGDKAAWPSGRASGGCDQHLGCHCHAGNGPTAFCADVTEPHEPRGDIPVTLRGAASQDRSPGCRACPPLPARALHRDLRPDSPSGSWQGQAVDLSAVEWPNPEDFNCLVLSFGDILLESRRRGDPGKDSFAWDDIDIL